MTKTGLSTLGRSVRWIDVTTLATGLPLRIAVHELNGARPGPTVGITASIHGDEVAPVEALRRLLATLDPADISGRLLVVPVVNPLAFQAQTRHTPQDMQNLNRVFPGDPDGWLTEQLAAVLVREVIPELDVLLDLHAGGALPTVDYAYIDNDEALSASLGTKVLYRGPGYPGTLSSVAVERGIRCVVTELGGGLVRDEHYIELTVSGLTNALRHAGVLPGDPTSRPDQFIVDHLTIIRPHHGGLLVPEVLAGQLGEVVPGGTLLGTVYNPQTFDTLEVVEAPFERTLMILTRGTVTRVEAGDYGWMVAEV
jgi:predicted deacylase